MLNKLFSQKKKKLIVVDGDCCLNHTWIYEDILGSSEVYVVLYKKEESNLPKILNKYPEIIPVPLCGFRSAKETVDKYMAMMLQKSISDGYTDINIISKDFDMLDIVDMAIQINEPKYFVKINIIMPDITNGYAKGSDLTQKVSHNFERNVFLVKQKKK